VGILVAFLLFGMSVRSAEDPRLEIPVPEGGQLRLKWTGGNAPFQVEQAPTLSGPWSPLGGQINETNVLTSVGADRLFFRVSGSAGSGISPEEAAMRATMSAVGAFVDGVPRDDVVRWRADILTFLRGRADIDSAGESEDGVWAITTDGIPMSIWNNRPADPPLDEGTVPQIARAGISIPGNRTARFAVTVGAGFRQAAPALSRLMSGAGVLRDPDRRVPEPGHRVALRHHGGLDSPLHVVPGGEPRQRLAGCLPERVVLLGPSAGGVS
jgi:hypothetical protein